MENTQELLDAVNIYFDAMHHCDVNLMDQIFHPNSSLFDADQGKIFVEPIMSFRTDVGGRKSPASIKQSRKDEILLIDYLSKDCALVKIRLQAHEKIFVDHLCLVRGQEGWRIVSKVWHLERSDG
ncbi:MAG: nuclear transport factor 2 family protein [Parvularculaceae bacterium]